MEFTVIRDDRKRSVSELTYGEYCLDDDGSLLLITKGGATAMLHDKVPAVVLHSAHPSTYEEGEPVNLLPGTQVVHLIQEAPAVFKPFLL